jgi:hypothetical protein
MRNINKKEEFKAKDFIEFSRKPKTAEQKANIKKGLKKFWDKKGRAVLTVGAAGTAAGGLLLAAKSGKIPTGNPITQKSQGLLNSKAPQKLLTAGKGGVDKVSREIQGSTTNSKAMAVPGVSSDNIVSQVAKTTGKMGGRAFGTGRATAAAIADGMRTGKKGDASYDAGATLAKLLNKAKGR